MSEIQKIQALEVMDSRGNPTVRAEVWTASGARGSAQVPRQRRIAGSASRE
jgi:enolase